MLSQKDNTSAGLVQGPYARSGPQRVNGSNFPGTRGDLFDVLIQGPTIFGAVGLDLSTDNGHQIQFTGRYGTQAYNGTDFYGFLEWHDNTGPGVYLLVEQYLAAKAGMTL